MKREIQVGQYIAYGLMVGRSANLAIYQVKEVTKDSVKGIKLIESYGVNQLEELEEGCHVPMRHKKWVSRYDVLGNFVDGDYVEMTPEEKIKADNKTTTIRMSERAMILDGFTPDLLKRY